MIALFQKTNAAHILLRYAGRQFFLRTSGILAGLSALLLVFDMVANADDILEHHSNILAAFMDYARLRMPVIIALAVPFCVLLSMMSIFARMARHQEIVALRAVGISIYHVLAIFAVAVLFVVLIHFMFANLVVPPSQKTLHGWAKQDYKGTPESSTLQYDPRWISIGDMMIYVGDVQREGYVLRDVDLIERNNEGGIKNFFEIVKATYNGGQWDILTSDNTRMSMELPFRPESFKTMESDISNMSYGALVKAVYEDDSVKQDQKYLYVLWLQRKIAEPLSALIMLLLAAPLALQTGRTNQGLRTAAVIIMASFCFFITERFLLSLGEIGYLPSFIAVWSPMAIFGLLGVWVLIILEG